MFSTICEGLIQNFLVNFTKYGATQKCAKYNGPAFRNSVSQNPTCMPTIALMNML